MARISQSTSSYKLPVTLAVMCAVLWMLATALGGCAGGSRGTGSYGVGGVRPVYINEQPPKKQKRAPAKSRVKALATPTPTPGN
jgi:hypothetical protein